MRRTRGDVRRRCRAKQSSGAAPWPNHSHVRAVEPVMKRLVTAPRLRLGLFAALLTAATVAAIVVDVPSPADVKAWVESGGPAAPLLFLLLYLVLTVLFFPAGVLTAAGGALFGVVAGSLLSVIGATAGATAAFFIGRRLGRGTLERAAGRRVRAVDAWLGRRGFTAVLYLRLIPLVPFNALNYASGVTGVSARDYVFGTALGIIPGAFAYAALGSSLDDPWSPEFLAAVGLALALAAIGAFEARRRGRSAPDG